LLYWVFVELLWGLRDLGGDQASFSFFELLDSCFSWLLC
jgi:hypothetical protein